MAKKLDLNKSVCELVNEYPELKEIMAALGFTEINNPSALQSAGRLMTIPRGAKMKKIPMTSIITAFLENGFELEGTMPVETAEPQRNPSLNGVPMPASARNELLKSYLKRLGNGEDLESVRADFVRNFSDVDASEIMRAEQDLMKEGTPLSEVQKLCDVHSALFHGATREEQIANAEKAVEASLKKTAAPNANYDGKQEKATLLISQNGHPLRTFSLENDALSALLAQAASTDGAISQELFTKIRDVSIHYAKKGDLLYPLLKVKYGISGPSDVMWTVDDEIRDELGELAKMDPASEAYAARIKAVLKRVEEMIYKEQNILFPICAVNFSEEEWHGIYRDSKDYADCFGVHGEVWDEAENGGAVPLKQAEGEVVMPGGHLTVPQLTALLNTIPLELTFIDADNINRFFNEGPKVFKRPGMALDREVFSCHPPKIEPMVRAIIDDFRSGKRDSVPVWMEKNGRTMLVTYMAVRDRDRVYLGTVEVVQDMEFAKQHFRAE